MPAGMPRFAPSRPRQSSALPQHPRQRLMATHQDTPSIGTPHPCGTSSADGCTVRVQCSLCAPRCLNEICLPAAIVQDRRHAVPPHPSRTTGDNPVTI